MEKIPVEKYLLCQLCFRKEYVVSNLLLRVHARSETTVKPFEFIHCAELIPVSIRSARSLFREEL